MVILQIFNRYQFQGGEEASVLRVADTLEKGHTVIRCYFDSKDWLREDDFFAPVRQALAMLRNPAAIRRVMGLIESEKPDLILLHNIFPICSAAMLWKLVRQPIPVVQYIHNFRPFSVNGYCWANNQICDSGFNLNYLPEIFNASWQQSYLKTAWYAFVLWLLHLTGCYKKISAWIAISSFMKRKFVEAGVESERIAVIRHSWNPMPEEEFLRTGPHPNHGQPYLLFLGRLTEEKGVRTLIRAWGKAREKIHERYPKAKLLIGGEGPLSGWVVEQGQQVDGIHYLGHVSGDRKHQILSNCTAMVVPSIWWEPLGIVVYEAYDHGKPVLASASGGLEETVLHEKTGMVHFPGEDDMLAEHMSTIIFDRDMAIRLGEDGRDFLLESTSAQAWERSVEDAFLEAENSFHPIRISQESGNNRIEPECAPIEVYAYLADQNPQLGRSLGISRMTEVVLDEIGKNPQTTLGAVVSKSSIQPPRSADGRIIRLPWSTRTRTMRVLTDNLHPLFLPIRGRSDICYFPKGFMPKVPFARMPTVATIHDTIIQYYQDHYPKWRLEIEYNYWAGMLINTLRNATEIMTVSENAKEQISDFMDRHGLPKKEIHVTYEPCTYEHIPQPDNPAKADYVLHLGSKEPHKRTAWLVRQWAQWTASGRQWKSGKSLPQLHVVGALPDEVLEIARESSCIAVLPFLEDDALVSQFVGARALIFPSEIEGFGLPALEAYYLGTPVCYHRGTSVEEVLAVATDKGGFESGDGDGLLNAFRELMDMTPAEVRQCGLKLRATYSSQQVVSRMMAVFQSALPEKCR